MEEKYTLELTWDEVRILRKNLDWLLEEYQAEINNQLVIGSDRSYRSAWKRYYKIECIYAKVKKMIPRVCPPF